MSGQAAAHTPGNWELETTISGTNYVTAQGSDLAGLWRKDPRTGELLPAEANGRLMAAAPTMLAALRFAASHLEALIEAGGGGEAGNEALFWLNDAIALATLPGAESEPLPMNEEPLPDCRNTTMTVNSPLEP